MLEADKLLYSRFEEVSRELNSKVVPQQNSGELSPQKDSSDAPLAKPLETAERLINFNFHTQALTEIRKFLERLGKELCDRHGLAAPDKLQDIERLLVDQKILNYEHGRIFRSLRLDGNEATHDDLGNEELAKRNLERARHLLNWLYHQYGDTKDYKDSNQVPPKVTPVNVPNISSPIFLVTSQAPSTVSTDSATHERIGSVYSFGKLAFFGTIIFLLLWIGGAFPNLHWPLNGEWWHEHIDPHLMPAPEPEQRQSWYNPRLQPPQYPAPRPIPQPLRYAPPPRYYQPVDASVFNTLMQDPGIRTRYNEGFSTASNAAVWIGAGRSIVPWPPGINTKERFMVAIGATSAADCHSGRMVPITLKYIDRLFKGRPPFDWTCDQMTIDSDGGIIILFWK